MRCNRVGVMLTNFIRRFHWVPDQCDSWRILDAQIGRLDGDCDDFAITVLWIMSGKSMLRMWWRLLTFSAVIWHCRTDRGTIHAALWLRRHGWIDSIHPDWSQSPRHTRIIPVLPPVILLKMGMAKI